MSIIASISDSAAMLAVGAVSGVLLGPGAAATTMTVPDRRWPWALGSGRWLLGSPARPRRRILMAVSGAAVLGSLAAVIGLRPAVVAFLMMGIAGVMLAIIDLQHHRLPDRLTLTCAVASVLALLVDALSIDSWSALLRALICAASAGGLFLVMAVISPRGMGLGDVKLAALLSLHTGWLSESLAVLALLLGFVIGAGAALLLLALRRVSLGTAIPFGPALLLGAWIVVVASPVTG